MRRNFILFTMLGSIAIVLLACAPQEELDAPLLQDVESEATLLPTAEPATTESQDAAPIVTEAPASVQHIDIPGDLPEYTGIHLYDHNKNTGIGSIEGDRFYWSKLERPYNNDNEYFPFLDITDVWFYDADPTWFFTVIAVTGPDANGILSGQYAVEVDLELEGNGEWLFVANSPTTTDWTTDGVQVWRDSNSDVGGKVAVFPDAEGINGDGYDVLVSDDPDAAWMRLSTEYPNSLEIAFKKSLFGEKTKFMVGAWSGTDDLNPALFDLNDHFTHEQAGALNPEYSDFYPIDEITEIDNTCRLGIGFEPAKTVKRLCP